MIELMIVIAIIAIIAAIAIPNLMETRMTAAESAAASSLRAGVFTGQESFRGSSHNDLDGDNKGEYGHLGMLAGAIDCWGNPTVGVVTEAGSLELLGDKWVSADVAAESPSTTDDVDGYFFASYLDCDSATSTAAAEINNAELYFATVAVPVGFNDTGRRAFVITNGGIVLTAAGTDEYGAQAGAAVVTACNNALYNGTNACFDSADSAVTRDNRDPNWQPQ